MTEASYKAFIKFSNELVGTRLNGHTILEVRTEVCREVNRVWGTDVLFIIKRNATDMCPICNNHPVPVAMWWGRSSRFTRLKVKRFYVEQWREWRYKILVTEQSPLGALDYQLWLEGIDYAKFLAIEAAAQEFEALIEKATPARRCGEVKRP